MNDPASEPIPEDRCRAMKISMDEFVFLHRQLASMGRLKIPIPDGLRALAQDVDAPELRGLIQELERDLSNGARLSQAIRKFPRVFPDLYLGLIEAAEAAGNLPQVLESLGQYSFSTFVARQRVKAALYYPLTVLTVIFLVLFGLLAGIVPRFEAIFVTLGVDLPSPTKLILSVSRFVSSYAGLLLVFGLAASLMAWAGYSTSRGRLLWQGVLLNVPIVGAGFRNGLYFLFSRTLLLLLRSGVPLARSLDLMRQAFGMGMLHLVCSDMHRAAENGEPLSREAERGRFFPHTFVWKLAFGEQKGDLANSLEDLANYYEIETQLAVKRGVSLVEPILICVMAIMVGTVVLSIFLPILKIQEALRRK